MECDIVTLTELHVTDGPARAAVTIRDADGNGRAAIYRLVPASTTAQRQLRYSGLQRGDRVEIEWRWGGQPSPLYGITPAPLDPQVPAWEYGPEADDRNFLTDEWTTTDYSDLFDGQSLEFWLHRHPGAWPELHHRWVTRPAGPAPRSPQAPTFPPGLARPAPPAPPAPPAAAAPSLSGPAGPAGRPLRPSLPAPARHRLRGPAAPERGTPPLRRS